MNDESVHYRDFAEAHMPFNLNAVSGKGIGEELLS